mmetsp:Transcript_15314/g.23275  ORF Transcript_15314/g.23275 Transcript_15314/m.23275 type:complete len:100 (-) Transcript_15314:335-634(-)
MNGSASKQQPMAKVDIDELNDHDAHDNGNNDNDDEDDDGDHGAEDADDDPPKFKKFKTQSEENFGSLQGAHSLRKLSPDHNDDFSPESDAEIDDEKHNE